MFNVDYYNGRKEKIKLRNQKNVNNFLASAFNFVEGQNDLQQQLNELVEMEKESKEEKPEKKQEEKKKK